MRTVMLAAVAAMLSLPAAAQAPPPVPRYVCQLPPGLEAEAAALLAQAQYGWQPGLMTRMGMLTGMLNGYRRGCQERYQRQVLEWQMEMQRYQMTR